MFEFDRIYREYFRDVELYMLALCRDVHLAEELTAEVFFEAMKALPGFEGRCNIRTWLCAIGKRRYISYLRKNRPNASIDELEIPDLNQNVEEQVIDRQQALEIRRVLDDLPEPYRKVFSLRVFGQMSFAQIGKVFGKNQNWACVTYHRARQKIRDELGE